MRYKNVCLESLGYVLPRERITSLELETRLAPLYERLRLPAGRLELMTGIRERRLWPRDVLPGDMSVESGRRAMLAAEIDPALVGAIVHGSVCRDYLEPATAAAVHHRLGLGPHCFVYDVSNACLGLLNGAAQVANMIELGQIRAGLVVGTESSRQILEATIEQLNTDSSLTRSSVKPAIASLTLGSASAAILLTHRELSRSGCRLRTAVAIARTEYNALCRGGHDEAMQPGAGPLMRTDSEQLLKAGVATGVEAFAALLAETGWSRGEIDKVCMHQVGVAHRRAMLEAFVLDSAIDFSTVETFGNTGAVALPLTLARAAEAGHLGAGDRLALLGIGSGLNSLMVAIDWNGAPVGGIDLAAVEAA